MQREDLDYLKEEYFHLQHLITDYDQKAISIKSWSVTLGMVGIGAALINKAQLIFFLSSGASICFWIIETLWKTFQNVHYGRIEEIENFFDKKSDKKIEEVSITDKN